MRRVAEGGAGGRVGPGAAVAVVAAEEYDVVDRNRRRNKILQTEIIPFHHFATKASMPLHEDGYDLVFTQRGQLNWQVSFDVALGYFHHCIAPTGLFVYSGFPETELPLAQHIFSEFFHVREVINENGWPILIGRPR